MKIHEYQAKEILSRAGVPVPKGGVADTPQKARAIAQELGGRAVIKAQVYAGGRGKAGGVKVVGSPQEAETVAASLLGKRLVTHQTGPEGAPVHKVLVEEAIATKQELYLSMLVDEDSRSPLVIASAAGGMEIEEVSARTPEKVLRAYVDLITGLQPYQGRKLAYGMGLPDALVRPFADMTQRIYETLITKDCSLVEINPLIITADGRLLALDAKINFDDDALFRHKEIEALWDPQQEDPLEVEARKYDISYVKLDGDVGCMVNGAGLAMATMDIVRSVGATPANFLDVGGGASEEQVARAFGILLGDPKVKRVLVNLFGGILRCDVAANGMLAATKDKDVRVPIVVRMVGTNKDEGKQILGQSSLNVHLTETLAQAADQIAKASAR